MKILPLKNAVLLFLIILNSWSYSQKPTNYTLGLNSSSCLMNDDKIILNSISVEPGVQFNDRWYINLSLGYIQNSNSYHPDCRKFTGIINSLSVSMRLLKPEYKLSPLINIAIGNVIYSNARGSEVGTDLVQCRNSQSMNHERMGTFNRFRYFAKMKYMLDIRLMDFNVRLGPTYNVSVVNVFNRQNKEYFNQTLHGLGIEVGVVYNLSTRIAQKLKLISKK